MDGLITQRDIPLDSDFDGVYDLADNCPRSLNADQTDSDNDGVGDICDNCPAVSNQSQEDYNNNGIGDACDDSDSDGFTDDVDACPDDTDNDIDSDGECGNVDNCPDDANPGQADWNGNGTGDACEDSDGDGSNDDSDPCINDPLDDSDGDGLCGDVDNCPNDANPLQENADGDALGDACDPDDDGDGIDDSAPDNCPLTANAGQEDWNSDGEGDACDDTDGDGIMDNVDICRSDPDNDIDGDGHCGDVDNCPLVYNASQVDSDSDGIGDVCDDSDGDGLVDPIDTCPNDADNDIDGDGVCGDVDNCPVDANPLQENSDSDGLGNACDPDDDDDGISDLAPDNCPTVSNPGQEDWNSDGEGDVCDDTDGDGIMDSADLCRSDANNDIDGDGLCGDVDNCPNNANPLQENNDGDSLGDACDPDDDNDGIDDTAPDNCQFVSNNDQADWNSDGEGDVCDDSDGDGIMDSTDPCRSDPDDDIDSDGLCGDVDNCPNDANPLQENNDGDALGDACDPDDDNDGIDDTAPDNCQFISNPLQEDWNLDGEGDACDDSDGDGIMDDVDPCRSDGDDDTDGDGFCGDVDNCPAVYNPGQEDWNTDGEGDVCDDSDGDGILDSVDTCRSDPDNDIDTDGRCGDVDNCPAAYNPGQEDWNSNGTGDACEDSDGDGSNDDTDPCVNDPLDDADSDGLCGDVDNCPSVSNPLQENNDGDSLGDVCDPDDDNDGIDDTIPDNCQFVSNPGQEDWNSDGEGDACDDSDGDGIMDSTDTCRSDPNNDADGDGVCGDVDNCPYDANPLQENNDGDSMGDACDPDDDNDGIDDTAPDNCQFVSNPGQEDWNSDGEGDVCDDTDGDGIMDNVDTCRSDPNNDADGDGVCGDVDNCPNDANPLQENNDGDAMGDACDPDDDNDGIDDTIPDNCQFTANPLQEDWNSDGEGDACDDTDGDGAFDDTDPCINDPLDDADSDGFCADVDNCPSISNPGQENNDGDSLGDACDPDDDNDGIDDTIPDNCQFVSNPLQEDWNSDGEGDACDDSDSDGIMDDVDTCRSDPDNDIDGDGRCGDVDNCPAVSNPGQEDWNSNGTGDACEDSDGDGALDVSDPCPGDPDDDADADGVCGDVDNCPAVSNSGQENNDGDSLGDACDPDDDNDGVDDAYPDNCQFVSNPGQEDWNSDGEGDACDDSDGDGIMDSIDSCRMDPGNDSDGDGVCGDVDNCPGDSNAGQEDNDWDGEGDACDPDDDNDGVLDVAPDNCQFIPNPGQEDGDSDNIGDVCDNDLDSDGDGIFNYNDNCIYDINPGQENSDGDFHGDACDNCPYVDNWAQLDWDIDGIGDMCDNSDSDSLFDYEDNCPGWANEGQEDTDGDGTGDPCDSELPVITGFNIVSLTETSVTFQWTTDIAVEDNYSTVDYGTGTNYAITAAEGSAGNYYYTHSLTINTLSEGTVYYFRINAEIIAGTTSLTDSFLTLFTPGNEPGSPVKDDGGDNSALNVVQNYGGQYGGSSYVLWKNGTGIYGSYFGNTDVSPGYSLPWGADGAVVDTNNGSGLKVFSDKIGSAVLTTEIGGTIYSKLIYDNSGSPAYGGSGWGTGSSSLGVNIASGTAPSAVIMYKDYVQLKISEPGQLAASMNIPANPFYDFDVGFSSVATGNILIDPDGLDGGTIIRSSNFSRVAGQNTVVVVPGNSFRIGDNNNYASDTATRHEMKSALLILCILGLIQEDLDSDDSPYILYSSHSVFSSSFRDILLYSIVRNNSNNLYSFITSYEILDGSSIIIAGYGCCTHSIIGAPNPADFIEIVTDGAIDVGRNDNYTIYKGIMAGVADTPPTNPLFDEGTIFSSGGLNVINGDVVVNTTRYPYYNNSRPNVAAVTDTTLFGTYESALGMNYNIMYNGSGYATSDGYYILRLTDAGEFNNIAASGYATSVTSFSLVDANCTFFGNVDPGDVVYNVNTGQYALVVSDAEASSRRLILDRNIFTSAGQNYLVFNQSSDSLRMLYAWEGTGAGTGNIYGKMVRHSDGAQYRAAYSICDHGDVMENVKTVEDGQGGAFVVYQDASNGNIYYKWLDNEGNIVSGYGSPSTDRGVLIGTGTLRDVKGDRRGEFYVLYENSGSTYIYSSEWGSTKNSTGTDAVMTVDNTSSPVVAYLDSGDIMVWKLNASNGGDVFVTEIDLDAITASITGLAITTDNDGGAILSWADDRYFAFHDYLLFAQAVDNLGGLVWTTDTANNDYRGVVIGVPGTSNAGEIINRILFYNDGGAPYGGLFAWLDSRNGRWDIFYDTRSR